MGTNRPLVFVDLDDTLFQTSRKIGRRYGRVLPRRWTYTANPMGT